VQAAVAGRPQQPSWQMLFEQALAVVQAPPTPTEPAPTQTPKLHALLAHTAFDAQSVPLPQPPQSVWHSSPVFPAPQSSVPSQKPSPQICAHTPAGQEPLRQAAPVVQGESAGSEFAATQKPKLHAPLEQAPFVLHA
jgi:hypothetical protein